MKSIKSLLMVAMMTAGALTFAQQQAPGNDAEGEAIPSHESIPSMQRPDAESQPACEQKMQPLFNGNFRKMGKQGNHRFALLKELNLSAEQKASIALLNRKFNRQDSSRKADFRQEMKQGRAERLKEVKALLDKDQLIRFEQLLADRKNDRPADRFQGERPNRHQMRGMQQGERMASNRPQTDKPLPFRNGRQEWAEQAPGQGKSDRPMGRMAFRGEKNGRPEFGRQEPAFRLNRQKKSEPMTIQSRALKQTDRLCKKLELTDRQAMKIYQINLNYLSAASGHQSELTPQDNFRGRKGELAGKGCRSQRADKEKKILAVLKPYQRIKYAEMNGMKPAGQQPI